MAIVLGKDLEEVALMSAAELEDWKVYHRIYPLPDPHWSTAVLASLMANLWTKSGGYKPEDFLPGGWGREQTPEETLSRFLAATGGRS